MKCPTCNTSMKLQHGKHGDFYYCPSQYSGCTQKTITKSIAPKHSNRNLSNEWAERSKGSVYGGKSCACGRNEYRIGGGGYCEYCGHCPS